MAYNTKTVVKITDLTARRVDYWDRMHFIKPSLKEASGYGTARLYSFKDLVQLKAAKTLIDQGLSLQKIRKAITYLKSNGVITNAEYQKVAGCSQRTATRDLNELAQKDIIKPEGKGRGVRYWLIGKHARNAPNAPPEGS